MNPRSLIIIALLIIVSITSFWFLKKPTRQDIGEIESIQIGTNAEFPPFTFIENDEIVGFDIDIAKEIAHRIGKKAAITNMSFDALLPELQLGNIHVAAAGITPSKEREKRVYFTTPHFTNDPLMAVQKKGNSPISTPAQLMNKSVAVNQGYTADNYITNLGIKDVVRVSSPLISTGLMAITSGQADVFIASRSSLQPFISKQLANFTISPIENSAESFALAVSKKYPTLYTSMQTAITQMQKDGTIAKLIEKWNLND